LALDCRACGEANRDGARFCARCGQRLLARCTTCDSELPDSARFCDACGAPVADRLPDLAASTRKIVTILFADLQGSTGLQESMDPESVRALMGRYYSLARSIVEEHSGHLVKFVGDGAMAVFGVPDVAEDDAARAVHASHALLDAFAILAEEVRVQRGISLEMRVGVNTGEVVVEAGDADVVGDAVNVAARLESAAAPGDVLVGDTTWRLTRHLAEFEAVAPLRVRGRVEPVAAYRLVALTSDTEAAPAAFVGRDAELAALRAAFTTTVERRTPQLATVIGSPGVGKSRLARELRVMLSADARVATTRCDATSSMTFAPVVELLADLGATDDLLPAGPERDRVTAVADGLRRGHAGTPEETQWAVRRLVEQAASHRPVVLMLDDVQWAEPLLLDLVEHLTEWIVDRAVLVVAIARPELRDLRPALTEGGGRATTIIALEGLDEPATERLAMGLLGADHAPAELLARLRSTTGGNPLYVRELVRMLIDDGAVKREHDRWTLSSDLDRVEIPPTINSLLAARIDRLDPDERIVLERAAVIGHELYRGALAHLVPSNVEQDLEAVLERLRRRELLEPAGSYWIDEPVLRFHHVLIRDAAYRRLLRETRADLHERCATWFVAKTGGGPEHDEVIGFHLEQAHLNRRELGPVDETARAVAEAGAERLGTAARRALDRDDLPAAASLALRALDCSDVDGTRAELLLIRCEALLGAGAVAEALAAIEALEALAARGDDARLAAWASCFGVQRLVLVDPRGIGEAEPQLLDAARSLSARGDAAGAANAHRVHASVLARLGRVGECEAALDRALSAARQADDRRQITGALNAAPLAALWGPHPVARAGGRCLDVIRLVRITTGAPAVESTSIRCQAVLEAMRGRIDAARNMLAVARRIAEELGLQHGLLETDLFAGIVELYAGEPARADGHLQQAYEGFNAMGLEADAAQASALRGRAALAQGDAEAALTHTAMSETLGGQDLKTSIAWRAVRAEVLAQRGALDEAVRLAEAAVALAERTDALVDHGDACAALAAVRRHAGDDDGARVAAEEARSLYERKGATALAARLSPAPAAVSPAVSPRPSPGGTFENTASRVFRTANALITTGRFDDLVALVSPAFTLEDRRVGMSTRMSGSADVMEFFHALRTLGITQIDLDVVATRGDRLALVRALYQGSAFEVEMLTLFATDEDGLGLSSRIFDPSDDTGALAELDALAAAVNSTPLQNRATRQYEESLEVLTGRLDDLAALATDDYEFEDRRPGLGAKLRGRAAFVETLSLAAKLGVRRIDAAPVAVRGDRLALVRGTFAGDDFEADILALNQVDEQGRTSLGMLFDPGDLPAALAELDARYVADEGRDQADVLRIALAPLAAYNRRDWAAFAACYAAECIVVDHRLAGWAETRGIDAHIHGLVELLALAPDLVLTISAVAAVSDRGVVLSGCVRGTDAGGGGVELAFHIVYRVDRDGIRAMEIFSTAELDEALAALRRFDGDTDTAAVRHYRRLAGLLSAGRVDDIAPILTDDAFIDDRRPGVRNFVHGREAVLAALRSGVRVGLAQIDIDVIATRGDRICLLRTLHKGERYEMESLTIIGIDESGRGHFAFDFDAGDLTNALALLEALATTASGSIENAASRGFVVSFDAMVKADFETARAWLTADTIAEDRRPGLSNRIDGRDGVLDQIRSLASLGVLRVDSTVIALRGDRLALLDSLFTGKNFEARALFLNEVDELGRNVCSICFDPTQIDESLTELDERFLAGEGAGEAGWLGVSLPGAYDAHRRRDWDAMTAIYRPDIVLVDHRPASSGEIVGRPAVIDYHRTMVEVAPSHRLVVRRQLAIRGRVVLCELVTGGEGGSSEVAGPHETVSLLITAHDADGRTARMERFELARHADAWSRFHALSAS
jgi:class 3 adenylate cyclase/tetratricopeptide (TPR) repeat protein